MLKFKVVQLFHSLMDYNAIILNINNKLEIDI